MLIYDVTSKLNMMQKSSKGLLIILGLLILNSVLVSAIEGRIGNGRMVLYPEVNGWTTTKIEKSILVKNVNNVSVNISLKIDENSSKFIEIIDKEFILESNTEKKAQFIIKVKKEGRYEGKINIFFTPIEGKEAGVVLPSAIIVIAKKDQGYTETKDESDNENSDSNAPLTGAVTGNLKISPVIIFSFVSTFILLVVLIFLIYSLNSKKKKLKENKKIKKEGEKNEE